jgi:hypothetical protein
MKKKYNTYRELADAFKSGELDSTKYFLMLDKGGTENALCYKWDNNLSDEENDENQDKAYGLFDCPEIEDAFTALEIPWEWC